MRKKIIAGNWKMNKDHREGAALAGDVCRALAKRTLYCDVVLIPPFTTLPAVIEAIRHSGVKAGAQDLFYEDEGAFTGEISGGMLRSLGCTYVLVGHSERRHVIGESADVLAKKLRAALRNGLEPIYCVGELLEQRESGEAFDVVKKQIGEGCGGLDAEEFSKVVIAYEPVWAIGTGKTATSADASEMHGAIRGVIRDMFGAPASAATSILYGGSVKPESSPGLLAEPEIDGLLVGGASLTASSFVGIVPR